MNCSSKPSGRPFSDIQEAVFRYFGLYAASLTSTRLVSDPNTSSFCSPSEAESSPMSSLGFEMIVQGESTLHFTTCRSEGEKWLEPGRGVSTVLSGEVNVLYMQNLPLPLRSHSLDLSSTFRDVFVLHQCCDEWLLEWGLDVVLL